MCKNIVEYVCSIIYVRGNSVHFYKVGRVDCRDREEANNICEEQRILLLYDLFKQINK